MENQNKHTLNRRWFLKNASMASLFMMTGNIRSVSSSELFANKNNVVLRFAVASDSHFGQPNTLYKEMTQNVLNQINTFHSEFPLDFCVLNGDLIHNDKIFMPQIKNEFDLLHMPYYVSRGNHDMVSSAYWESIWEAPLNYDVVFNDQVILIGDTSDEKGTYRPVDMNWLAAKLEQYKDMKNIFLFLHIPQVLWSKECVDTPGFQDLIQSHKNVKALFHGHEHNKDGAMMIGGVPCLYDSHIGGNWGLPYKGFRVVEIRKDNTMATYMMNPSSPMNTLNY